MATVETEIAALPISEQCTVRSLADHLKGIARAAAAGAQSGMNGSERLLAMYERKIAKLPEDHGMEDLRPIAALAETAQKGASLGLALMQANKASIESQEPTQQPARVIWEVVEPEKKDK
jgi:hypothetical protein